MAAVDPKPTYTLRTESCLLALGTLCRRKGVRDKILEFSGYDLSTSARLDIVESAMRRSLVTDVEEAYGAGDDVDLCSSLLASHEDMIRKGVDADGMQSVCEAFATWAGNPEEVFLGSRAAYKMMHDIVMKEGGRAGPGDSEWSRAAMFSASLVEVGAAVMKMHPQAVRANLDNMVLAAARKTAREFDEREIAEDLAYHTVSRRVRAAYAFASTDRSFKAKTRLYPNGVSAESVLQLLSGKIRREAECAVAIDYFFLGPIRAVKRSGVLYIMDTDNIRKVYHVHQRKLMAVLHAHLVELSCPVGTVYSAASVRHLSRSLIKTAARHAEAGRPISTVARAMHQLWCAKFAAAYDEQGRAYWEPHYIKILADARAMCTEVDKWDAHVSPLSPPVQLELLRLHHILPAPDTPADMLADLVFDLPNRARAPDPGFWSMFMKFAKTYELSMYLYKKKEWPTVAGNEALRDTDSYKKCLRGKFSLPAAEEIGALWISNHFPYIKYADQFPLRAKDATRMPYDHSAAVSVTPVYDQWQKNELLHALKKGMDLGSPLCWDIARARKEFWDPKQTMHVLADAAAKAEGTKSDCKPRGTFSANGEFRHIQAEFDRNCQVMNDIIGCGSIRADVASHARGIANVTKGTANSRMTTSHDISDWSGSQDRDHFIEFGMYRAGCFANIDPNGWASKWRCFDIAISKPGVHEWKHQANGGYQGFPGTLDTSLHVLILTFFLWRMRSKGLVPPQSVTIAKATIDDCLAQMETWLSDEQRLEDELREHYIKLGYEIDTVKSVISKCKAIYLNQASINGACVHQGLKVILKADRPLETVLGTPLEDMMSCMSSAKAAIQAGGDVLATAMAAGTMGIYYLIRGMKDLQYLDCDSFAIAATLPRGDGGLGLPIVPDLVAKEHPDQRAHCNHALYIWARGRMMVDRSISNRALHLWANLKQQPWGLVSKHSIFFNPRNATREAIYSPENVRRSLIIQSARAWATAEPYRSVLKASRNEAILDLYGSMVSGAVTSIDATFMEAYAAHLPESVIDSLVGKVTSYRVASEVCGAREIVAAQAKMAGAFSAMAATLVAAMRDSGVDARSILADLMHTSGYMRAKEEREEFYAVNCVKICNHTIASPFEVITVTEATAEKSGTSKIESNYESLRLWAPGCVRSSRTTVSKHGVAWPFKAQNWVADSADTFRYLDGVCNKFVEGCAILEWARSAGMDIAGWKDVFMMRWIGEPARDHADFVSKAMQGSIKRSSSAWGDRYHPVFAHPNLQRSVNVTVGALQDLLSEGSYDIDPMSIVATAYAIGATNLAYIMDQFALVGEGQVEWVWTIGIHPDVYEESKHVDISIGLTSGTVADIFEMELEGTEYLVNDGGTAEMLRALLEPGGLQKLLAAGEVDSEEWALPDSHDLAPMISLPSDAPAGAAFITTHGAKRSVGTLVTDSLGTNRVDRMLEISPSSTKLCVIAAIQSSTVPVAGITARLLGDPEAISDADLADYGASIACDAKHLIAANIPTAHPMHAAANAMRSCGMVAARWDDLANLDMGQFRAKIESQMLSRPGDVLRAFHTHLDGVLKGASLAYETRPLRVRQSKNPDVSNGRERVSQITRKYRARAKEYEARVHALKAGTTELARDKMTRDPRRKLVYLVAARTYMQCVEFTEGPAVDVEATASRILSRVNAKLRSYDETPNMEDPCELVVGGKISRARMQSANFRSMAKGWFPDEYARGICAAQDWSFNDCEFEKTVMYFCPRLVTVKVRVKRTGITATKAPRRDMRSDTMRASSPSPGPSVQAEPPQEAPPAEAPQEEKPARAPRTAGGRLARLMAKSTRRPLAEYSAYCSTLDLWQLCVKMRDLGIDCPDGGTAQDQMRVGMQGAILSRGNIGKELEDAIEAAVADMMYRTRSALTAPTREDIEVDESLAV